MKILIITRSPWDDTNNTGNTMTNFWSGWDVKDIANIYCRASMPNNRVCREYFSISDKELLKSILNFKHLAGNAFCWDNNGESLENNNKDIENERRLYNFFRNKQIVLAQWAQELLWVFGKWKNVKLDNFIYSFKPDIIFSPCFESFYSHKLLWHLKNRAGAKVVLFHGDDYLNLKGRGGSPLSKINKILLSRMVARSAKKADLNYCNSPKQQEEYSLLLGKKMKLLYKGADFGSEPAYNNDLENRVIKIVYIGSILYGRWKTLGMLSRAILNINSRRKRFELHIYSQYQPSNRVLQTMVLQGASRFLGKVPASAVPKILSDADIVLHVESFDKKERISTRLSFSTKIVDCLRSGRCVFAIGWEEAASIDYLIKNKAAIVANDEKTVFNHLERILENPAILSEYALKAWQCGKRNHQIDSIQRKLYEDLHSLAKESLT